MFLHTNMPLENYLNNLKKEKKIFKRINNLILVCSREGIHFSKVVKCQLSC